VYEDAWYVICDGVPAPAFFVAALDSANLHVGGAGIAGGAGEPIQFSNGRNWFLRCDTRLRAEMVAAFLHGRVNNASFHSTIINCRFIQCF
jgi:hypothetical protein